jgi:hypothetical protein
MQYGFTELEREHSGVFCGSAFGVPVLATLRPRAPTVSATASTTQTLENFRRVAHPPGGLLHRLAVMLLAVLAPVTDDGVDSVHVLHILDALFTP